MLVLMRAHVSDAESELDLTKRATAFYEVSKTLNADEQELKVSEQNTARLKAKIAAGRLHLNALAAGKTSSIATLTSGLASVVGTNVSSNGTNQTARPAGERWMAGKSRKERVLLVHGEMRKLMSPAEVAKLTHDDERKVRYCIADLCAKKPKRLLHKPVRGLSEMTEDGRLEYDRIVKYRLNGVTATTNY